MTPLTGLKIVLELIPALIAAIRAIEEAIPGQGQGEAKLAAIRQIIESGYSQAKDIWPLAEKAVAALVGLFNATGVFTRS